MRQDEEIYKLIDDYLGDKLSEKESLEFEQKMNEDPDLKEEVFYRKISNELVVEERYFEIAKSIRNAPAPSIFQKYFTINKFLWGIAFTALTIATIIYFTKQEEKTEKPGKAENNTSQTYNADSTKTITDTATRVIPFDTHNYSDSTKVRMTNKKSDLRIDKPIQKDLSPKQDSSFIMEISIDSINDINKNQKPSYNLNSGKGELWRIPLPEGKKGSIKVFNEGGQEVYNSPVSSQRSTWNGFGNDGSKLKRGIYTYLLDLGNNEVQTGNIIIE